MTLKTIHTARIFRQGDPYEDSLVVDCISEGRGGIAVAECPSYEGCRVNERSSTVVYGRVVGVEGCADEIDLLLGNEDRVGDVEQGCERGSRFWVGACPQGREVDG